MQPDTYISSVTPHTEKDTVIEYDEKRNMEKVLNGHTIQLARILKVGEKWKSAWNFNFRIEKFQFQNWKISISELDSIENKTKQGQIAWLCFAFGLCLAISGGGYKSYTHITTETSNTTSKTELKVKLI